MKAAWIAAASAVALISTPALADVITLDFEGVGNMMPVGDFYAPDYIFSPDTLAVVDLDAGGDGNFANEPSPDTTMFFLDADNAILDVVNGFTDGFSFYYSSSVLVTVTVYDAPGAMGNVLASLNLQSRHSDNCTGDPNGDFCNFTPIGVTFEGIAYSIDFGGAADYTGFDNITFGSDTPGKEGNWGNGNNGARCHSRTRQPGVDDCGLWSGGGCHAPSPHRHCLRSDLAQTKRGAVTGAPSLCLIG